MTDIPLAREIDHQNPIEIETETGIIRLLPSLVTCGGGKRKCWATIDGVCHSKPEMKQPCHVLFRGRKIAGSFTKVKAADYLWQVTYETLIAVPEFWAEA